MFEEGGSSRQPAPAASDGRPPGEKPLARRACRRNPGRSLCDRGLGPCDYGRSPCDLGRKDWDRGPNHSDQGGNHSDLNRNHCDHGRSHYDHGRNHCDHGRNHCDEGGNHSDHGGNHSDQGRSDRDRGRSRCDQGRNGSGLRRYAGRPRRPARPVAHCRSPGLLERALATQRCGGPARFRPPPTRMLLGRGSADAWAWPVQALPEPLDARRLTPNAAGCTIARHR